MFPHLRPFAEATDTVRAALLEVGKPGGILDARDQLSAGPKALIIDPTVNGNATATDPYGSNPDNPTMTAGSTFVGQFVDHDITFDQTSQLGVSQNPPLSPNTRTPALDLDSVFGGGPGCGPTCTSKRGRLGRAEAEDRHRRCARGRAAVATDGTYSAVLGDPRNDENVIIAGLHCAHILFYNRVLDELRSHDVRRFSPDSARARRPAQPLHAVPARPRGHAVALPMAAGQRAPAADRWSGHGRRRVGTGNRFYRPRTAGVHADRVRRRRLPLRPQHGSSVLPRELHQRHRR